MKKGFIYRFFSNIKEALDANFSISEEEIQVMQATGNIELELESARLENRDLNRNLIIHNLKIVLDNPQYSQRYILYSEIFDLRQLLNITYDELPAPKRVNVSLANAF